MFQSGKCLGKRPLHQTRSVEIIGDIATCNSSTRWKAMHPKRWVKIIPDNPISITSLHYSQGSCQKREYIASAPGHTSGWTPPTSIKTKNRWVCSLSSLITEGSQHLPYPTIWLVEYNCDASKVGVSNLASPEAGKPWELLNSPRFVLPNFYSSRYSSKFLNQQRIGECF